MDKLKMKTQDVADQNFRKLAELFPNAVTETVDENGHVVRAIDKDVLTQEINTAVVEGREERYQFTWPDKRKAIIAANTPTTNTLRPLPDENESVDFWNTQNLYIEGDNLEVLKLLQENYLGKVKMIYIDPPYNTGNDFVYKDDFAESTSVYMANSGQYDEEGNRLVQNPDTNGRFHTDWLNMIYPRLKVARNLLAEDGVIFISIDETECSNLKKLGDEVFGENNFLSIISRRTKAGGGSASKHFAIENDFIYVYAKNATTLPNIYAPFDEKYLKRYAFEDEKGKYFWDTMARACTATVPYLIEAPDGTMLKGNWFRSEKRFLEDKKKGEVRIIKKENGDWSVQFKQRMAEGKKVRTLFAENEFKSSQNDLDAIGLGGIFSFPKPVYLLKYIIKAATNKDSLILDFFSGSATTAHAVMQLNAEDGGKRKFIMVQLPEETAEGSEAHKAGYKNICEIGKERIRRAGKKIKADSPLTMQGLDTGFRVLRLDSSNMEQVYYTPEETVSRGLFDQIDNIKPDRTGLDLLFQAMLELGVPLSAKIETTEVAGKTLYAVDAGYITACFDRGLTDDVITAIAHRKPYYFVMRDAGMADDSVAVNFEQLFKSYSPETILKVI